MEDTKLNASEYYNWLIDQNADSYQHEIVNSFGQIIEFYEHPLDGDMGTVIAVCHELKLAADTAFYDLDDMCDGSEYNPVFYNAVMKCEFDLSEMRHMKLCINNIPSKNLRDVDLKQASIFQIVYARPKKITGYGLTLIINRITPKQVECIIVNEWFPSLQHKTFGRIANGENVDKFKWLREHMLPQRDTRIKFWKETGTEVGATDPRQIVEILKDKKGNYIYF